MTKAASFAAYDKDYQTRPFFYNYFFLKENRNQRFSFLNLIFKKYERVQESRSDLIGEMEDWS